jgi:hypothetical protein
MLAPAAKRLPMDPMTPPPMKKNRLEAPGTPVLSADEVQMLEPQFNACFAEAYAIDCTKWYEQHELTSSSSSSWQADDRDLNKSMELIPGRYFKVANSAHGGIFRQEMPEDDDAPNTSMLFLHCTFGGEGAGWYISTHIDLDDPSNVNHAWGKGKVDGLVPGVIHVPYWAKKANQHVVIQPLLLHNEDRIRALHDECERLEFEMREMQNECTDKGIGDTSKGKVKVKWQGQRGDAAGKSSSKGKVDRPPGAGWMNRTVPLAVAILVDDIPEAKKILDEYTAKYLTFNTEIEKSLKKRLNKNA